MPVFRGEGLALLAPLAKPTPLKLAIHKGYKPGIISLEDAVQSPLPHQVGLQAPRTALAVAGKQPARTSATHG